MDSFFKQLGTLCHAVHRHGRRPRRQPHAVALVDFFAVFVTGINASGSRDIFVPHSSGMAPKRRVEDARFLRGEAAMRAPGLAITNICSFRWTLAVARRSHSRGRLLCGCRRATGTTSSGAKSSRW